MTKFHENLSKSDRSVLSGPAELFQAIGNETLQKPVEASNQLSNYIKKTDEAPSEVFSQTAESGWAATGKVIGSVMTFAVMALAVRRVTPFLRESSALTLPLRAGAAGSLYEAVHPVDLVDSTDLVASKGIDFVRAKRNSMITGFGTFATMAGAAQLFDRTATFGRVGVRTLAESLIAETTAGAIAGLSNAELTALSTRGEFATGRELQNGAKQYAQFGLVYGAAGHYIGRGRPNFKDPREGQTAYVSTEQYVSNSNSSAQLESKLPIYNWIAERNPSLRPKNFEPDKPFPYGETHSLTDWEPAKRPAVVRELRRIAKSNLASDGNLDAFLNTLAESKWAKNAGQEKTASEHPARVEITPTQSPQSDLSAPLQSLSSQRGLGRLSADSREAKPGKDAEANLFGMEYSYRRIGMAQGNLAQGLTRQSGPQLMHEFLHHERGDTQWRDSALSRMLPSSFTTRQHLAALTDSAAKVQETNTLLQMINTPGGANRLAQELTGVSETSLASSRDLSQPVEAALASKVRETSPGRPIDRSALTSQMQPLLENLSADYQNAATSRLRDYLFSTRERQAHAIQALATIRASVIGLPE